MKLFHILFLFFSCSWTLCAQTTLNLQRVQLLFEDAIGQKDTIEFGASFLTNPTTAPFTLGMDAAYNEVNLYGQAYQSLDARIIQRDSLNHECIKIDHFSSPSLGDLYFPTNLDSKIDFRPNAGTLSRLYNSFEIQITALHYPVTIYLGDQNIFGGVLFHFMLLDSNCYTTSTNYTDLSRTNDTLFILNNPSEHIIIANLDLIVSTDPIQATASNIELFPNPASQHLSVKGLEDFEGTITVLNSLGQPLIHRSFYQEDIQLTIANLPNGVYFLRCYNKQTQQTNLHSFIKQSN